MRSGSGSFARVPRSDLTHRALQRRFRTGLWPWSLISKPREEPDPDVRTPQVASSTLDAALYSFLDLTTVLGCVPPHRIV